MPHGMPTKLRSARWQSWASSSGSNVAAVEQRQGGGDFQRGRRTQPGAVRHGAADQQIGRLDREAGAQQFLGHADRVVRSNRRRAADCGSSATSNSRMLAAVFRIDAQLAVGRGRGSDVGGQIQGHGQHKAEIVVGVLADQVDPAGGAKDTQPVVSGRTFPEVCDHEASVSPATP